MSPVQPGGVQQPEVSDEDAIRTWLDALASGKCSDSAFLQAMHERFRSDPEANWEVLSQLDQHFRRGRIPTETFRTVKTALAESALRVVNPRPNDGVSRTTPPGPAPSTQSPIAPLDVEARSIPIARDVVASYRSENTDIHQRRDGSQTLEVTGEPKPGSVLRRRYRLETLLGQGSTGPIFQAVDEYRLDSPGSQRLAIKILHPAVVKRAELLAELRREFQTLQLLSHPNIVRVFEFDRDGSLVFFTMELLTGATLGRVLQARKLVPLPVDQALAATREIGAALAYAHSRSIVHGDISPRNIFITGQGDVRVLGFPGSFRGQNAGSLDHELTLPIATSGYASCQVLDGERPDARDDVFALACIAYLLLCGEHPLKQKTAIEARDARMSIRRPAHLNHRQWQALRAGLRWERQNRPGDVLQWLQQLDLRGAAKRLPPLSDMLEPPPRKKPRSPWAAATAVGVLLLLAAAYWFISHRGILPRLEPAASSPLPALETTPPVVAAAPPALKVSDAPAAKPSNNMPPPSVAAVSAPPPPTPQPAASSAVSSPPAKAPPIAAAATASAPVATAGAGSSRLELSADTVDVPSGETEAQVSVHRKGSLRGETSFTWWTESGTAKPGTDFSAVMPQIAHIGDGKSTVTLSILLSKAPHTQAKSFYVVIDQAEGGAPLTGRTLTMVTLQPPG